MNGKMIWNGGVGLGPMLAEALLGHDPFGGGEMQLDLGDPVTHDNDMQMMATEMIASGEGQAPDPGRRLRDMQDVAMQGLEPFLETGRWSMDQLRDGVQAGIFDKRDVEDIRDLMEDNPLVQMNKRIRQNAAQRQKQPMPRQGLQGHGQMENGLQGHGEEQQMDPETESELAEYEMLLGQEKQAYERRQQQFGNVVGILGMDLNGIRRQR